MSNIKLSYLPGVCKVNTPYADSSQEGGNQGRAAIGRIVDMDKGRFVAGLFEKLRGWEKLTTDQMDGTPRGLRDFRDYNQVVYLAIGTSTKLYVYSQSMLTDVTPFRAIRTGTITNKISTTNGSATVNINHTSHGLRVDDYVILTAASAVGGLTIAGVYWVASVVDADNYTITASSTASSTAGPGGGATTYEYFRITISNPFDTTSGSTTVTVHHTAHGAQDYDFVAISNSSAVGGVTPSGSYQLRYVDADTYTITLSSSAASTVTGGGGSPEFEYDINTGNISTIVGYGYGTGGYGTGGYGETGSTGVTFPARTWSLDRYGQQLLANPTGGGIYVWDPIVQGRAYPLYNAPTQVTAMFVTSERFVFALGVIANNPMSVAWPDQNDYTDWTSSATNTANSGRTLQEGSVLVSGVAVRDFVSLVFTNTAVYVFTYTGDNNVYASSPVGINAGLAGPLAKAVMGGSCYWMSTSNFWVWDGSVRKLPADDVRDFVFEDINTFQSAKFVVGTNLSRNEVWFFYCSSSSDEIDRYVIFHTDQDCWSCGTMVRTSWLDRGLFSDPLATSTTGYIYEHEVGNDDESSAIESYVQVSPVSVGNGDAAMDIFAFIPDIKDQSGDLSLELSAQYYPSDTATVYGPYTIADDGSTPIIDLRFGAKLVSYTLTSNTVGGDFRVGMPRLEGQPGAARR